jgi:hypothetical protein
MMFKNESDMVAIRAEKRYEELARQKAPMVKPADSRNWICHNSWPPPQVNTILVPETRYPTPESMVMEIAPSIEDHALGFFVGNYVAQPTFVPRGQFEWITEALACPNTDKILRTSVDAACMAAFANATKSPVIMNRAQAAYGSALRMTNSALRIKEMAVKDSTLISVIMLGMYENFVFQDDVSIQAWAKHVDGACAIFKLRGKDQFQSSLGRRIYHQFFGTILLVAYETGTAVHEGMRDMYTLMTMMADYSVVGRPCTRVIHLLHDIININHTGKNDPKTMLDTALAMGRDLEEVKSLMPSIWNYDILHLKQASPHLYGDTYHMYLDPWIAQMWNNLHSCQLYLYTVLRENLIKCWKLYDPPLFSLEEYDAIMSSTEEIIRNTAASIVASVPQITGMVPFPESPATKPHTSNPNLDKAGSSCVLHPPGTFLDPTKSNHLVHLIWPLYGAAQSDEATPEMRQWTIDMLHFIALRIGTRQAIVLANELKKIQQTGFSSVSFVDRTTLRLPPGTRTGTPDTTGYDP